ncbi:CRIB domain-containing protein [Sarracenia purpurea var. burkii]
MRDRMEKLVVLPFSVGCVSESSVALGTTQPKKPKSEPDSAVTRTQEREESSSVEVKMKNSWGFLAVPKPIISIGIQRLTKTFKSFSQLFGYKEEMEDRETEMEIGLPTNVKHVTHIGWDGTTTTNPVKGWEDLTAPEILSFPSVSMRRFELSMFAQAS